jgi:hypothetical protein
MAPRRGDTLEQRVERLRVMANKLREKARLARLVAFLTANPQRVAQLEDDMVTSGGLRGRGGGCIGLDSNGNVHLHFLEAIVLYSDQVD